MDLGGQSIVPLVTEVLHGESMHGLPAEVGQAKLPSATAAASSFRLPREIGCISEVWVRRYVRSQSCTGLQGVKKSISLNTFAFYLF